MSARCDAKAALRIAGKQKRLIALATPEEVRLRIAGDRARQLGDAVQRGRYIAGYHQKRWSTWKVKESVLIIAFKVSSLVINDDGAMPIWIISCLDILLGYLPVSHLSE